MNIYKLEQMNRIIDISLIGRKARESFVNKFIPSIQHKCGRFNFPLQWELNR